MTYLKALAQKLADAKAAAETSKTAYDALKAKWEARPEVAAVLDAKKQADTTKKQLEAEAREALEQKFTDGVTISSTYYDIQTTVQPDYTEKEVVEYLITQAPALAIGLLKVDEKALGKLISANAMKEDSIARWPDHLRHLMAPVKLNVVPKPRIMWSKLPAPLATPVTDEEKREYARQRGE